MHNGTRDRVQTYLTVVGGSPTNLSHERTPWGVSTEQARSVPGGGFFGCFGLWLGCCMVVGRLGDASYL